MNKFYRNLSLVLSVLVVTTVIAYTVMAWVEPGGNPPTNNADAPITTGLATQTKTGGFNISGDVGIGTTSPSQKLDVAGYIKGQTGICIGNQCCTTWAECVALAGSGCKSTGVACGNNSECCTANCSGSVCAVASSGCKAVGEACSGDGSCCTANCINGYCAAAGVVKTCTSGTCPSGYECKDGNNCCKSSQCGYDVYPNGQCVDNGGTRSQGPLATNFNLVCRNGDWKTMACAWGCDYFACDTGICQSNMCASGICGGPASEKRIFVTSNTYPGSTIPTDAAADALCQDAAYNGSMTARNSTNNASGSVFRALVYLGGREPNSVLSNAATSFVNWSNNSGTWTRNVVATGSSDFFTAEGSDYLRSPILYNQFGNAAGGVNVWTNFEATSGGNYKKLDFTWLATGYGCWVVAPAQSGPCREKETWMSTGYSHIYTGWRDTQFWYGNTNNKNVGWGHAGTFGANDGVGWLVDYGSLDNCVNNNSAALYCVEQ